MRGPSWLFPLGLAVAALGFHAALTVPWGAFEDRPAKGAGPTPLAPRVRPAVIAPQDLAKRSETKIRMLRQHWMPRDYAEEPRDSKSADRYEAALRQSLTQLVDSGVEVVECRTIRCRIRICDIPASPAAEEMTKVLAAAEIAGVRAWHSLAVESPFKAEGKVGPGCQTWIAALAIDLGEGQHIELGKSAPKSKEPVKPGASKALDERPRADADTSSVGTRG